MNEHKTRIVSGKKALEMDAVDIFKPSLTQFYKQIQAGYEPTIFPICDLCGENYPHYYASNEDWEESGLSGWVCLTCMEEALNRDISVVSFWGNLFESRTNENLIEAAMWDYIENKPTVEALWKFIQVLYPEYLKKGSKKRLAKEFKII